MPDDAVHSPLARADRARELDAVTGAVATGLAGRATTVVVTGPAGIGKSWLLQQLTARIDGSPGDGPALLRIDAHPTERDLPYAGLHQLLAGLEDRIAELPPPRRRAIDGALARESVAPSDAFAAASGLHQLVTDLAEDRPVLILVDDLPEVDAATGQLLGFLTRRLDADRVAVVLTARGPHPPDLRAARTVTVELVPLDDRAARALVRHEHPAAALPAIDAIVTAAQGLPLALTEIPAELSDGQLRATEELPAALPLGSRLGALCTSRLADLDDNALLALLVASLEPLPPGPLAATLALLDLDLAALEPAERSGLIRLSSAGAQFPHAATTHAVQGAATSTMRARAHRALATTLCHDPARRARHLAAVVTGPDPEVADALTDAALDAESRGAWLAAGQAHEAAADRSTTGEDDARRRAVAAYAHAGAAGPLVVALRRLAAAAPDAATRLAIHAELLAAVAWTGRPDIDADVLEARTLADRLGPTAPSAGARLRTVAAFTLVVSGRAAEAGQDLTAARTLDPVPTDPALAVTYQLLESYLAGSGQSEPLIAWAEALTDAELATPSLHLVAVTSTLIWADEPARADALLARQCRALRAAGAFGQVGISEGQRAVIAQRGGNWVLAEARFATAVDRCTDTDLTGPLPHIQLRYAYLLAAQGRAEPCEALIAAACSLDPSSALLDHLAACIGGLLALSLGHTARARSLLARAGDIERQAGIRQPGYSSRAADLVEAHWRLRDLDAARAETDALTDQAERWGRAGPRALAARCQAMLGVAEQIDEDFAAAVAWHRVAVDAFEEARTELAWGRALRRTGRKRDARAHLRAALDVFERAGTETWAEQARSELAACGERRAPGRSLAMDLTPRELEVAVSVARGASNPETAAELCISRRTVEDHLGRVYRKLGVSSRHELADRLLPPLPEVRTPGR